MYTYTQAHAPGMLHITHEPVYALMHALILSPLRSAESLMVSWAQPGNFVPPWTVPGSCSMEQATPELLKGVVLAATCYNGSLLCVLIPSY